MTFLRKSCGARSARERIMSISGTPKSCVQLALESDAMINFRGPRSFDWNVRGTNGRRMSKGEGKSASERLQGIGRANGARVVRAGGRAWHAEARVIAMRGADFFERRRGGLSPHPAADE